MKIKKIILIGCLCGTLSGCGTLAAENFPQEMTAFPSYDWSMEDGLALAQVAADCAGTDIDKQKAVIDVLNYVWYQNPEHTTIADYVAKNYNPNIKITKRDKELVYLITLGRWAE